MAESTILLRRSATSGRDLTLNWLIFLFSPILGAIVAIHFAAKRRYAHIYVLGALFALFAAFLPPTSDAYRYRMIYLSCTSFSLNIDELWVTQKDFLYQLLSFLFNKANASWELFRVVMFTACYSMYIWTYIDLVKRVKVLQVSDSFYHWGIVAILFSIRLFTLAVGIRFGLASTIVIIAMYLIYREDYVKGIVLYVVSATLHFSMLMFAPCIIMSFVLKHFTLSRRVKFAIMIILLIFSNAGIGTLLNTVFAGNALVERNVDGYISGQWGTENIMATASFGGLMFSLIRILPVFPLTWFETSKSRSFLSNLGFMLVLVLCISFSSITLLLRYSNVTSAILLVSFLTSAQDTRKSFRRFRIITYSILIVFGAYVYSQRHELTNTHLEYYVMLSPVTLIAEPGYSEQWIHSNINSEGYLQ